MTNIEMSQSHVMKADSYLHLQSFFDPAMQTESNFCMHSWGTFKPISFAGTLINLSLTM